MNNIELCGKLGETEASIIKSDKAKMHFYSNYEFLKDHNGFRNGCLHIFMGVTHGGKSTLTRSLLIDVLCNRPKRKILLWLSEETRVEFLAEFSTSGFTEYDENQLLIYSELDHEAGEAKTLATIEHVVTSHDVDIVFFDNITTSRIYMDKEIKTQSEISKTMKNMAARWNIPLVLIAHTGSTVTENYSNIINMNDIRGGKSIVNMAQFFYIMQSFYEGNSRTTTIRTTKHRGYIVTGTIYQLIFSVKANIFAIGAKISFQDFSTAYKNRNKL